VLAVWSLANPSYPVWHAATASGVSSLGWSAKAPGTLAAGFHDGGLATYDVSSSGPVGGMAGKGAEPVAQAPPAGAGAGARAGHAEPVWRVAYVPQAADTSEEMLVSVSGDGSVFEWKHGQGLERTELLRLKRTQRSVQGGPSAPSGSSGGGGGEGPASGVLPPFRVNFDAGVEGSVGSCGALA
jgi:WD40 repeat protein